MSLPLGLAGGGKSNVTAASHISFSSVSLLPCTGFRQAAESEANNFTLLIYKHITSIVLLRLSEGGKSNVTAPSQISFRTSFGSVFRWWSAFFAPLHASRPYLLHRRQTRRPRSTCSQFELGREGPSDPPPPPSSTARAIVAACSCVCRAPPAVYLSGQCVPHDARKHVRTS